MRAIFKEVHDLFFDFTTFHIYLRTSINWLRVVIGDFQASAGKFILFQVMDLQSAFTTAVKKWNVACALQL